MPPIWNRALVTGASSGIGEAFARRLADDGTDLVLVARRGDVLADLADELRTKDVDVQVLPADLTNDNDLQEVLERTADTSDPVDLLVNNAGFGSFGRFHTLDPDEQDRMIRLNISAVVALSHAAIPVMKDRGRGGILNVASVGAFGPVPWMAVYGGTKAFVLSFSEGLHEELRRFGIHVSCLSPGLTRTEFQEVADVSEAERLIPSIAWSDADSVAKAGLDGIRSNQAIVTPGANVALQHVTRMLPSAVIRKATALAMRSA